MSHNMRKHTCTFWYVRSTKTQACHLIRSESSLSAWRNFASLVIQNAACEDSDQTVWNVKSRLIWIFDRRTCPKIGFLTLWLKSSLECFVFFVLFFQILPVAPTLWTFSPDVFHYACIHLISFWWLFAIGYVWQENFMNVGRQEDFDWLCWGLTTRQPLWVILCRLPEKGRKSTEEIAEEMKERDREERETGMKVKKQKK